MALDSCWKVAVIATGPGGEGIVNTFYYAYDNPDSSVNAQTVADKFDDTLPSAISACVTADWTYRKTTVHCITGTNAGKTAESTVSAGLVGTLAGPPCPIDVCAIAKKLTGGVGKKSRGRFFLSPIPAANVDVDGRWTPPVGFEANLTVFLNTVSVVGQTFKPVVTGKNGLFPNQITAVHSAEVSGVQKRRRLRQPN